MDLNELFLSCKKGDLEKIKFLITQKEVELNVRDNWDSTPLYYACLCGHIEVVQYLLENGARCEANTFDGERCFYGALTNDIRNLLWNFKVVSSQTIRRDFYEEFLRKLYEQGDYSDIQFIVEGNPIQAHKCILAARSPYFREQFNGKWKTKDVVMISNSVITYHAFMAVVMQYLYTGRLETPLDKVEDCIIVAKQCQLHNLIDQIELTREKVESFVCSKPGMNVKTLLIENDECNETLRRDFAKLAWQCLPPELSNLRLESMDGSSQNQFSDVCFCIEGFRFLCHKAFYCGQSDFFKGLLADHFSEFSDRKLGGIIPEFQLCDITIDTFTKLHMYVYQNSTELSSSNVFDIMCVADLYLLQGLKRYCANFLGTQLEIGNVIEIIKTSRLMDLPRLEEQCAKFIMKNLDAMLDNEDFHKLILEDAKDVKERQETDSITVIDDIRYHITNNMQTFESISEANAKLMLIEELLHKIGLDA